MEGKYLKATDKYISIFEESLLFILIIIMPIVCFAQVFFRYLTSIPVPWTDEALRVLFIWSIFIGGSIAVGRKAHLGVEVVLNLVPYSKRKIINCTVLVVSCIFCFYMTYTGLSLTLSQYFNRVILPITGLPNYICILALPVGFFLAGTRFLLLAWEKAALKESNNVDYPLKG